MQFFTLADIYRYVKFGKWMGIIGESTQKEYTSRSDVSRYITECEKQLSNMNHGEKVIILVSNSIRSACSFLAIWGLGGVAVPVKEGVNETAVHRIADDCNARYIINPDKNLIVSVDNFRKEASMKRHSSFRHEVCGSDIALIIYTSGSTGNPKGIVLTHQNVITALYSISTYLGLTTSDSILCLSPLSFDYGLYQVLFSFAIDLKTILYNETIQPYRVIKAINDHRITILPIVPAIGSMLEKLLNIRSYELKSLQKITNTGGHLSVSIIENMRNKLPHVKIYAMYGLTECKRCLYLPPEDIDRKIGSVGLPIPGVSAGIFLSQKSAIDSKSIYEYFEVGPNEIGELFIKGSTIMQGYCRGDSSAGARILAGSYRDDVWLATGDLFYRDEEGYFYFKGRKKELIKQGAYCLYPKDLEEVIMGYANVQIASIVGKTDKDGLEYAVAFIQLYEDSEEKRHEVIKWVKTAIDQDYMPRELSFINNLPLDHNGKVDKKVLIKYAK